MIACYLENISEEELIVEGESFIHLNSALRVREGDEVLALDGVGGSRITRVETISKKSITLSGGSEILTERRFNLDLLLAPPKREAFNDCLRFSCEIGIRNIYLFQSEFTQNKKFEEERIAKILRSGIVQSNNPFLPKVTNLDKELGSIGDYDQSFIFHLGEKSDNSTIESLEKSKSYILALGPEGGFSNKDVELLRSRLSDPKEICLETPILRTPTALCVASGWLLSKI